MSGSTARLVERVGTKVDGGKGKQPTSITKQGASSASKTSRQNPSAVSDILQQTRGERRKGPPVKQKPTVKPKPSVQPKQRIIRSESPPPTPMDTSGQPSKSPKKRVASDEEEKKTTTEGGKKRREGEGEEQSTKPNLPYQKKVSDKDIINIPDEESEEDIPSFTENLPPQAPTDETKDEQLRKQVDKTNEALKTLNNAMGAAFGGDSKDSDVETKQKELVDAINSIKAPATKLIQKEKEEETKKLKEQVTLSDTLGLRIEHTNTALEAVTGICKTLDKIILENKKTLSKIPKKVAFTTTTTIFDAANPKS